MKKLASRSVSGLCLALTVSSTAVQAQEVTERAPPACSLAKLSGHWGYSEQGTLFVMQGPARVPAPFGEVGWLRLRSNDDGKLVGHGLAFLSIGGQAIPPAGTSGIPLTVTEITLDPVSCTGFGTFFAGDPNDPANRRTITFVLAVNASEFYYISTTGDLTAVGTAKRQR